MLNAQAEAEKIKVNDTIQTNYYKPLNSTTQTNFYKQYNTDNTVQTN